MYESPFITVMRDWNAIQHQFVMQENYNFYCACDTKHLFLLFVNKHKAPKNFNDLCFNIIKYWKNRQFFQHWKFWQKPS